MYTAFLTVQGWGLGILAIILAVLLWFYSPDTKVPLITFVVVVLCLSISLIVMSQTAYSAWRKTLRPLPCVKRILDPPEGQSGPEKMLLVEPSELFSVDTTVSLYLKDDDYEKLIAIGRVLNVQSDGHIQIVINTIATVSDEIRSRLGNNDSSVLKKLLVKPTVPSYILEHYNV